MNKNKTVKILLIEDNEGDVMLTQRAFEKSAMDISLNIAYDGHEGMQYLRQEGEFANTEIPDIILLDINMPKMNGKEVLEEIKNDERLKIIPVIMLTSSEAQRDILESYKRHANSYVIKPFSPDEFCDVAKKIEEFWLNTAKLPSED